MNESFEQAVLRARKEWLEQAMKEAEYSVHQMAKNTGMNRTHAYKVLKLYAPHIKYIPLIKGGYVERHKGEERVATGGNEAWKALDDTLPVENRS